MHPDEMFTGANFMARISVADKSDLFVQLCRQVATLPQVRNSAIDYDRILSAIREREAQSSTAIGNGVILPHARIDGLDGLAVVVATLQTPLSGEEAIDRQPLDIACLLLIPAGKPMEEASEILYEALDNIMEGELDTDDDDALNGLAEAMTGAMAGAAGQMQQMASAMESQIADMQAKMQEAMMRGDMAEYMRLAAEFQQKMMEQAMGKQE